MWRCIDGACLWVVQNETSRKPFKEKGSVWNSILNIVSHFMLRGHNVLKRHSNVAIWVTRRV